MTPKLVLSICGDGAVGKGTLIDKIARNDLGIRERFGVIGTPQFYASRKASRSGQTAYRPLDDMFSSRADTIVYRWQTAQHGTVDKLFTRFPPPGTIHRLVLLWRPWEEHRSDQQRIHTGREVPEIRWKTHIVPIFGPDSALRRINVELLVVDASQPGYPAIDWPAD